MREQVLVVDDDPHMRAALRRALKQKASLEVVGTGEDGVAIIRAQPGRFVLALVDYALPGIDGSEAIARIRDADPGVLVVVMSGVVELAAASRDVRRTAGAIFVGKPLSQADLDRLLDEARSTTLEARIDRAVNEIADEHELRDPVEFVFRRAAHGDTRNVIAEACDIGPRYLGDLISELLDSLHVRSLDAAAQLALRRALRNGTVPTPPETPSFGPPTVSGLETKWRCKHERPPDRGVEASPRAPGGTSRDPRSS